MSEQRFFKREYEEQYYIFDSEKISENDFDERYEYEGYVACEDSMQGDDVVNRLNEQQATIEEQKIFIDELIIDYKKLEKENEQLRQMIKENVFQRYKVGSLADLKFKAIAYDDIVKVEISYESEPKVIVYCKQGKREDIKSFCQMFIPFGVYYEINEVIE